VRMLLLLSEQGHKAYLGWLVRLELSKTIGSTWLTVTR
jgi:hypothetical protein